MLPAAGSRARLALVAVGALLFGAALGFGGGLFSSLATTPTPSAESTEAGFARDMQTHHLQGAELALLAHERSTDPEILTISTDILLTQQQQSGQMFGWLTAWDLAQASSEPPMAWMGRPPLTSTGTSHDHTNASAEAPATMPGYATREQIDELTEATGDAADRLFLRLMIAHHRGAIEMADALLERSTNPMVTTFARNIVTSQRAEIDLMLDMIARRGG